MNILKSIDRFEHWLRQELAGELVQAGLTKKHEKIAGDPFAFLRGTYWRWAEIIKDHIGDTADAPSVLAVGDIHLENFGTWRDPEGRLVWGVNDYDEAAEMPYTLDLVRLATSALLAVDDKDADPTPIAAAILDGYAVGLENPRPFILDGGHDESSAMHRWLREQTITPERERKQFWDDLERERLRRKDQTHGRQPSVPAISPRLEHVLRSSLPADAGEPDIWYHSAGLGSLGRPRFVARAAWRGGWVVREAKAIVPSTWTRVHGKGGQAVRCMEIASGRHRCPDPWYRVSDSLVVRRLSPNNRKIECKIEVGQKSTKPPHTTQGSHALRPHVLLDETMLRAMGQDLAAVHMGTDVRHQRSIDDPVRTDCRVRTEEDRRWLERATCRAADVVRKEWKKYRSSIG